MKMEMVISLIVIANYIGFLIIVGKMRIEECKILHEVRPGVPFRSRHSGYALPNYSSVNQEKVQKHLTGW